MKLSTKNIISVAILVATSLTVHARPTFELKGVDKAVHVSQEKVNNKVREEFMGLQEKEEFIDIAPYAPLFDLVCQSDLTDWCSLYPEQCSYVKTLCVKDNNDNYCAFDIYQKYIEATKGCNNNMNAINSYIDLCDSCLIEMANEFQKVSQDEEAIYEMKTLADMCTVKMFMDSYINDGNKEDSEIISTLASLVPIEKSKLKRHFGKIHSFKNPEAGGFVKSNGKIKYGNVGINEKVNSSIHNKNRANFPYKRQEYEEEEVDDMIILDSVKTKIYSALSDIKELALQKVSTIFSNLELNVSVMLEDDLFISDPEATREKNILTDDILSNIKDILNSDVSDIAKEIEGYILDDTVTSIGLEAQATPNPVVAEVEEAEEADIEDDIPTEPIDDIFQEVVNYPVIKKSDIEGEIFEIPEEDDEYVYIASQLSEATSTTKTVTVNPEPTETPTFVEQEVYPEIPTAGFPIVDSGTKGEDELSDIEGILKDENDGVEVSGEGEEGELGDDESDEPIPETIIDEGPHHGETPFVKPETPFITPSKPQRPNNPWKFGFKTQEEHKSPQRKPSILKAINKLFEENKYTPSTPEEAAPFYTPIKNWVVKKSEYVVSKELLNEDIDPEYAEIEDIPIQDASVYAPEPLTDEDKSIKLNNLDNHRDNNEDEVFEIGSKKVSFVNSIHPTKPSLNFRDNENKDTH